MRLTLLVHNNRNCLYMNYTLRRVKNTEIDNYNVILDCLLWQILAQLSGNNLELGFNILQSGNNT